MKQTAVEWLVDNLISEPYSEADFKHNSDCWDKAKAMEKKQIIDALMTSEVELLSWGISAEKYYNETFKSE